MADAEELLEEKTEEELMHELELVVEENKKKIVWLLQEKAPINQGQVAMIRLNLLIDSLGLSSRDRVEFELQFEAMMSGLLDYMASAVTKAKFTNTQGVDLSQLKL